jgi:hypothetical protein
MAATVTSGGVALVLVAMATILLVPVDSRPARALSTPGVCWLDR